VSAHLAALLSRAAAETPDRVALVEARSGRRLTWAELDAEADRVARGLAALGLVAGYRVAVALPNRVELVVTYLGALRAGLVVVPVNPRSATGELVRMLVDCGARLVLADVSTLTTVRQAVAGLQDALVGADEELRSRTVVPRVMALSAPALPGESTYDELLAETGPQVGPGADLEVGGGASPVPRLPEDAERLAVLLYTSGTSGRPRAAMLTHRALLANVEQAAAVRPPLLTGEDVVLGVLPMFHVYGLNAVLGQVLRQRARLVVVDGFEPRETLDIVEHEAVTVLPVAPPVLVAWRDVPDLRERLAGVRLVLSGSAPLSPDLVEQFTARTGLDVHQGYGLTEAAPIVTSTLCSRGGAPRRGSVGAPLPGIELRLRDESGGADAGDDPGEIWVRGDNLFSGYWPDGPDGPDGPDADGWFATGDVGILDADGDLFLVDRVKELVVVSGFNVYPTEVEDVLTELESVAEAAVIGTPDERTGEAVVAYVRPVPGSSYSADEVERQVREHCAVRLARFKHPREVHVVEELPHTVIGKVAKGRLRARRRAGRPGLLE
jgi:long-chain acyl-CoA synthetase